MVKKYHIDITKDNIWSEHRQLDGKIGRKNGPAIMLKDGTEIWLLDGEIHREDGPAVTYPDGIEEWLLYGISYSKIFLLNISKEGLWFLKKKYLIKSWCISQKNKFFTNLLTLII